MEIEPPRPLDSEVPPHKPVMSMTFLFFGIAVILTTTVVLWLTLWSGGISKAAKVADPVPATQPR